MLNRFRAFWTKLLTPIAKFFLRHGVSADVITLIGTIGVVAGALIFYPQGELLIGTLVITAFVFSDLLDGTMARMSGTSSQWGAFLDSTLDRFGDAAVFGGLVMYFVGPGDSDLWAALALYCLVMGSVTSYARARAEALGMEARGGIAERADRLVAILVMTGLSDIFNLGFFIPLTLGVLAVASTITVFQRVLGVRTQAKAAQR
jgi:CDP-diacylglycerol--glycerol-3-phosphate 3-phosphatidyltransferase/CDP-diacylglycerol--inositol 3-phosphatidyltransferase